MSRMSDLSLEIQDLIVSGVKLEDIATKLDIPLDWVESEYETFVEFELGEGLAEVIAELENV